MDSTLVKKIVVVINGKGGSGKDTICNITSKHYNVRNISTITPIKEIAHLGGWQGGKLDRDRKFLSDLKKLFTDYNDLPNNYATSQYKMFLNSPTEYVLFVHIREPENIERFKNSITGECITLLIRGGKQQETYGNKSDDEVENYSYDYIYNNTKPIEKLEEDFLEFFKQIVEETEKRYLPH